MSYAERIRAERDLTRRDELEGRKSRNSRLPAALFSDSDDSKPAIHILMILLTTLLVDDEDATQKYPRRRIGLEDTQQTALDDEDDEDDEPINLEDKKGLLARYLLVMSILIGMQF